jgi:predicted CXXCH cytochrome family protein
MEVTKEDADHKKPEDVLCYQCHKSIPTGRYIHGPAAVWNCIGCHNPEMSPVKYQFASIEPWQATKTVETAGPPLYLKTPAKPGLTVKGTCLKCHAEIAARTFKHGPADAGYCNLCHDPHASSQAAWLRKPAWDLCTTCHTDKASGVHVVAGFVAGKTHPTRFKPDPMRPGKRLTCASCHDPHGAESRDLFVYGARSSSDLCKKCHMKK